MTPALSTFDVIVVGAGATGLTLGVGLARAGFNVAVIGPAPPARPGRTVALLDGSVRLLKQFGFWAELADDAAPMRAMRIVDATDSVFRPPPVTFAATDLGLPVFGFNVENAKLEQTLLAAAAALPRLRLIPCVAGSYAFGADQVTVTLADGGATTAPLLIAADGRHSLARKMAGIGVRARSYPQVALTALLAHDAPHRDVSTEFHTRQGPFTLVPLAASSSDRFRSSLVWVMSPQEATRRLALPLPGLAEEMERQSGRALGSLRIQSEVGSFPISMSLSRRLTGPRLALTGEAAHALPPIGAQGMNLSLRDVAALVDALIAARGRQQDLGSAAVLDAYAALREGDVALRALGVDALNGSLLAHGPAMDMIRGAGLSLLQAVAPLRRWLMRQGLAPESALLPRPDSLRLTQPR